MKWILLFLLPFVAGCRMTKFVQEEGVALQNHVIKTVTAAAAVKCRWDCVDELLCFSINVRKLPTGRVTCELNNSSKTADPQNFTPSAGSQYHQMAEVQHCTMDECVYKDALPDGWYRVGAKLFKLFPERRTWEQARKFCQSISGELVSINSEDENEFVYNLLLGEVKTNRTGEDPDQTIAHWVLDGTDSDVSLEEGAKYEEEDDFKSSYLDGSGAYATTPAVDLGNGTSFTIGLFD